MCVSPGAHKSVQKTHFCILFGKVSWGYYVCIGLHSLVYSQGELGCAELAGADVQAMGLSRFCLVFKE